MATPAGKFDSNDAGSVLKSLMIAIASAVVTWLMSEGLDLFQEYGWLSAAVFPLVFAILSAIQTWLSDTRPSPNLATKPL